MSVKLLPELDQSHQICSIIITITPSDFSITLQLEFLCAKNCRLQCNYNYS